MNTIDGNKNPVLRVLFSLENGIAGTAIILLALIPCAEIIVRTFFRTGIPAASEYTYHLVIWITFFGGMITSREGRHLHLSAGIDNIKDPWNNRIKTVTAFLTTMVIWALFISSLSLVLIGFDPERKLGLVPIRLAVAPIPIGYAFMALRSFLIGPKTRLSRFLAGLGLLAGTFIGYSSLYNILYTLFPSVPVLFDHIMDFWYGFAPSMVLPGCLLLIAGAIAGIPLFAVLGGLAYFLFIGSFGALEVIPNEAYTMLTGNTIPAIPLFTLAGFILSESKAGERLVRLFKSLFGWMPGGLAIMAVLVCTFFTTFTGASGVTILALGGLLSYILLESGRYTKKFSNGLLTASGSIGLLFPPSLPIILYGVVAQVSILDMFIAGIVPGVFMVLALSGLGLYAAVKRKVPRTPFNGKEALHAIRESIWELLLPVIIILFFFLGITTLVETGAIAVIYALIIEMFIHKDINRKTLPKVLMKSLPIIGGVLVILAVSRGLSYYIIDAEIPMTLTAWVSEHIHSKYVFLILLNLALLVTGCLMDIFSAIMVVVPLILPLGNLFGIHPAHLGIIFLANLELGYLTPPVGLNLFLASYRFEEPLGRVYKQVIPFFLLLLLTVLVITYVPWISTMFL